jgi:uncharacterized OB-fold protein
MATYERLKLYVSPTNSEHRGYYEHAKQGHLVVQRCTDCNLLRGSIGAACPFCTSLQWEWQPVSGRGVIYSYQIVTQAVHPAFHDWVPYPIVLVELDEQRRQPWRNAAEDEYVSLRIVANLVKRDDPTAAEDEDNVMIGKRVEVCFLDVDETMALPQFVLTDEPPEVTPWRAPTRD